MNDAAAIAPPLDPVLRARALGPAILAAGDEIERTQEIPESVWSGVVAAKLHWLFVPKSVGGEQVDPWVYMRTIEEISRYDGSLGWNLFVANSAALIAPYIPFSAAAKIWSDPRATLGWGPPNASKSIAVPGGYRVTGQWHFASGSRKATYMGAHTQVVEPDGSLRLNQFGRPAIRTFLFPAEHAERIQDWDTVGMRGTASEGYRLNDLFVPEEFTGTREDPTLRRDRGPLYAFTTSGLYAVGVAGVALGLAGAMLDELKKLALEKAPRGLDRMADTPLVQDGYARHLAKIGSSGSYLVDIMKDIYDRADDVAPIRAEDRAMLRLGCSNAIAMALKTADWVYKAAGTSAIFKGSPFERRWRDIHTLSQQVQSRDSHFETVGRILFNGDPTGMFQ